MMNDERRYWLDEPRNVKKIVYALFLFCALLILADLFFHKHSHFPFEEWFGFYGFFGFFACIGLVLTAKGLRILVKRSEDYYERDSLNAWGKRTGWGLHPDPKRLEDPDQTGEEDDGDDLSFSGVPESDAGMGEPHV